MVPALLLAVLWMSSNWTRRALAMAWIGATLSFGAWLPRAMQLRDEDTIAASLVWESVGMYKLAGPEHMLEYVPMEVINYPGRPVRTPQDVAEELVKLHDWHSHGSMIWPAKPVFDTPQLLRRGDVSRRAWWRQVQDHPMIYARAKWEIWRTMLGTRPDLPLTMINTWSPDLTEPRYSLRQRRLLGDAPPSVVDWFFERRSWFTPFMRPWPWLITIAVVAAVSLRKRGWNQTSRQAFLFAGLGLSYYATFFVLSPGFQFRYFMPAQVLILIAIVLFTWPLTRGGSALARDT
jgi:hypothetical protein